MREHTEPPACARPQCGNLKDERPWCPTCECHFGFNEYDKHRHGR